ncbi:hypothetical protein C2S53_010970 [Perilla frutescens var. hirtella]|uniref:Uncharacterized protein n=1 Tax=Perilla frutescens var. hirtella TaxID=608512 RepID=A0AAD4JCQ2_PERFH|nr:hypothetical protein C2S53_010970 [Perilla frutescens var. hirtella]
MGFALIIFLILVTALTQHFALVSSQYDCSTIGNYTSESLYRFSLNSLLPSLSSNIGNAGFYDASGGGVYAAALCRADMQLEECRGCLDTAATYIIQQCPNQLEAVTWFEYCMVRYSNNTIVGTLATSPQYILYNLLNVSSPQQFIEARASLLDELREQAAEGGPLRKAAAGNRTSASEDWRIYGLVQCTPDLSPENCSSCLAEAARFLPLCCEASQGARVYMPSCNIRYENSPFVNLTRLQEPLIQPSAGLQEPPIQPSAANADDDSSSNTRKIIIIIVSSIVAFVAIAAAVGILAMKGFKLKRKADPMIGDYDDDGGISTVESIQYDFDKIKSATNDFSDANELGQGGFGTVYKGKLENGREIAVKRLSRDLGQGDLEFKNEVLFVARLQHRNLVRLLGFSMKGPERLLVYEFVQNGSLDQFIFDRAKAVLLDWESRYKIIGGVARGVLYLHEDSRLRIIHRDLKASNVLLNEEMNPKISDFGLAKLVEPDATQESTSRIVGTYGYMAPEYAYHGHFSIKSDIYSFGVLVLEIVSGQKKTFIQDGHNSGDLLSYAWRSWREGTSANIIDPFLKANGGGSQQDMVRCIHIALLCVQENPDDRPTMASVVVMLNSFSLTLPQPTEPGFYMSSGFSKLALSNQTERSRSSESLLADQPVYISGNHDDS